MATPQPRRRHRKDDSYPLHPIDRSLRLPVLPQRQSRFGNSRVEQPSAGMEKLRADIEHSRHVPDIAQLQDRLRAMTKASRLSEADDAASEYGGALARTAVDVNLGAAANARELSQASLSAPEPQAPRPQPKLFRRRIRAIRDAAEAAGRQCTGLDGVLGPICTAYEQLLTRALHSAPHLIPADLVVDDDEHDTGSVSGGAEPLIARTESTASPANSPLQERSPIGPTSHKTSFARLAGVASSATLLGMRRSQSNAQLKEAESRAGELAERVDFLERENEELRVNGEAMREAAGQASRRLDIAVRALQRSQLLEDTDVSELEDADVALPNIPGMTLQVLAASFKRREERLVRQVEQLEAQLAFRNAVMASGPLAAQVDA